MPVVKVVNIGVHLLQIHVFCFVLKIGPERRELFVLKVWIPNSLIFLFLCFGNFCVANFQSKGIPCNVFPYNKTHNPGLYL